MSLQTREDEDSLPLEPGLLLPSLSVQVRKIGPSEIQTSLQNRAASNSILDVWLCPCLFYSHQSFSAIRILENEMCGSVFETLTMISVPSAAQAIMWPGVYKARHSRSHSSAARFSYRTCMHLLGQIVTR